MTNKITKTTIYLTPLIILLLIFYWQTNPFGQQRTYEYDFSGSNKVITHLGPTDRIQPISSEAGKNYQELKPGLVYFTLERVDSKKTIELDIEFTANTDYLGLGVEKNRKQEADFEFRPLLNKGVKTNSFVFSAKNYFLDSKSLRFAFSVPALADGQYVRISKISATFDEPADDWVKKLHSLLVRLKP